MTMPSHAFSVDNNQDVIDSRDVIERLEYLSSELESDDASQDEKDEFAALVALQSQGIAYSGDWEYSSTLVRDSYFVEYAHDLADDIGAIDHELTWPHTCIDWEQAARELQADYTSVDFAGVTYWVR